MYGVSVNVLLANAAVMCSVGLVARALGAESTLPSLLASTTTHLALDHG